MKKNVTPNPRNTELKATVKQDQEPSPELYGSDPAYTAWLKSLQNPTDCRWRQLKNTFERIKRRAK